LILEQLLQEKFGYHSFRQGQKEIILDILQNNNVFAMLPTGAGKSITYLLPGYVFDGIVVIVSPLLSLMEDQVKQLKMNGEKRVVAINSFLHKNKRTQLLNNLHLYKFIYLSPETLQNEVVVKKLKQQKVSLFVVDEAHCISQWGHEFRTDYLKLGHVRESLGSPPCLALTATAPKNVQDDIINQLTIQDAKKHLYNVDRPNIAISINKVNTEEEKTAQLLRLVKNLKGPGIVYFSSRKVTEKVAQMIQCETELSVAAYHGGLETEDRILLQQQFVEGQLDVICCTSAFGMGINKLDTRFVIHFHFPGQIEAYVQEIGRAGRDGKKSIAILLYLEDDQQLPKRLVDYEFPDDAIVEGLWQLVKEKQQQDNLELDSNEEQQWCESLQIPETMWRFLKFQLEQLNILQHSKITKLPDERVFKNEILGVVNERKHYKNNKLQQMLYYIHSEDCLRKFILATFDQQLTDKPLICCTNCSFNEEEYYEIKSSKTSEKMFNWRDEMKVIFNQSDDL
jgi:ATP-dependent DNA helicase RecQ